MLLELLSRLQNSTHHSYSKICSLA